MCVYIYIERWLLVNQQIAASKLAVTRKLAPENLYWIAAQYRREEEGAGSKCKSKSRSKSKSREHKDGLREQEKAESVRENLGKKFVESREQVKSGFGDVRVRREDAR